MPSFRCATCGETHDGFPMAYRFDLPNVALEPGYGFRREGELIEAGDERFILANIELPVSGVPGELFVWTCWISLSRQSYDRMDALWESVGREDQEPAFGWLSNALPTYEPSTQPLKTNVHTRPVGYRPWVELEPTEHPLAIEQREGMQPERIAAVFHFFESQRTGLPKEH